MEYESVYDVAAAYKAGEISLDEAVQYITDRWEWPYRTVDMLINEEDLDYPPFCATEVEAMLYGGPLASDPAEAKVFTRAVFRRVTELIDAGIIPPRPPLRSEEDGQ